MKAITMRQYGKPEVLKVEELPKPEPKSGEIRVKVYSTTVTAGTVIARLGSHPDFKAFTPFIRLMMGLFKPRKIINGYEFAGQVDGVGTGVQGYKVGDRVYGTTTGLDQGSYAEYVCVPTLWKQGVVDHLPNELSYDEGAALPVGAMTAYDLFKKASITKGKKVLVYGASGSVGTYMVQLAKVRGAQVTAVCSSKNATLMEEIGADNVLDYNAASYKTHTESYDVIADAVGKLDKADKKRLLKKDGLYTSISSPTKETMEALKAMTEYVKKGSMKVIIGHTYQVDDIQKAHAHAEKGHKTGNMVIQFMKADSDN